MVRVISAMCPHFKLNMRWRQESKGGSAGSSERMFRVMG